MSETPSDGELSFPDMGCFGCSPSNRAGLGLRFGRRGEAVFSRYAVPEHYQGAPGVVHGGILATVVDEVSCAAAVFLRNAYVVTGELTVRYLRPCPVATPLEIVARVIGEHPRYLIIEAEVRRDATLLARSTGKFFPQARTENAP
jgi:acyl-coenzyme A thioesterase PaaI-like protein